jgi:hypothetical protein
MRNQEETENLFQLKRTLVIGGSISPAFHLHFTCISCISPAFHLHPEMEELEEELRGRFPLNDVERVGLVDKDAFIRGAWLLGFVRAHQIEDEDLLFLLQQLWTTQSLPDEKWKLPSGLSDSIVDFLYRVAPLMNHLPAIPFAPTKEDSLKLEREQQRAKRLRALANFSDDEFDLSEEEVNPADPLEESQDLKPNRFAFLAAFSDEEDNQEDLYHASNVDVSADEFDKWWTAVDTRTSPKETFREGEDLLQESLDYETLGEDLESNLLDSEEERGEEDSLEADLAIALGADYKPKSSLSSDRARVASQSAKDRLMLHTGFDFLEDLSDPEVSLAPEVAESEEEIEYEYVDEDGNPIDAPEEGEDVDYEYVFESSD